MASAFVICSPGAASTVRSLESYGGVAARRPPTASRTARRARAILGPAATFELAGARGFFAGAFDVATKVVQHAPTAARRGLFIANDSSNGAGAAQAQPDPAAAQIAQELMSRLMTARMIAITSSMLNASRSELMLDNGVHLEVARRMGHAHGSILRLLHPDSQDDFMRTIAASGSLNLEVPEPSQDDTLEQLLAALRSKPKEAPAAVKFAEAVEAFAAAVAARAAEQVAEGVAVWAEEDAALVESIAEGLANRALREEDLVRAVTALGTLRQAKLGPCSQAEREAYAAQFADWLKACSGMGDQRGATIEHLAAGHLQALGYDPAGYPIRDPDAPKPESSTDADGEEVMRLSVAVAAALASRAADTTDDAECLRQLETVMEGMRAIPDSGFGETRTELVSVMAAMLEAAVRPLGFLPEDEPPCTSLGALGSALRMREAHPLSKKMGELVDRLFPLLAEEPKADGAAEPKA